MLEGGLTGAQDLKLAMEGDVVQLFRLLQLPLQLLHISRPLVDLACMHGEFLLLLDDGAGLGLGRCVELLRIGKGPLGLGVVLGDGLHLQL
jgi:hypothetical protein